MAEHIQHHHIYEVVHTGNHIQCAVPVLSCVLHNDETLENYISLPSPPYPTSPIHRPIGLPTHPNLPLRRKCETRASSLVCIARQGQLLLSAGNELQNFIDATNSPDRVLSAELYEKMFVSTTRHLHLAKLAGIPFIPKHHLWLHLVTMAPYQGNPRFASACPCKPNHEDTCIGTFPHCAPLSAPLQLPSTSLV